MNVEIEFGSAYLGMESQIARFSISHMTRRSARIKGVGQGAPHHDHMFRQVYDLCVPLSHF